MSATAEVLVVPTSVVSLTPWVRAGVLGAAEVHGAAVLARADVGADEAVQLAAALALWAPGHGHACVDLAAAAPVVIEDLARRQADGRGGLGGDTVGGDVGRDAARALAALPWPSLEQWLAALHVSPICRVVEHSGGVAGGRSTGLDAVRAAALDAAFDDRPLVLDGTLLYTQRQWIDEQIIATDLRRRCAGSARPGNIPAEVDALLAELLPADAGQPNLQHEAARAAIRSGLTVVVGGPGTGKTHTIARALAAMVLDAAITRRPLRIALAAPTGKAAARMGEALVAAVASFAGDAAALGLARPLTDIVPTTIHRLLGVRGQRTRFVHDPNDPLDVDVIVIDEASMVALPLMARLLEAVRPETRVVLVGDPDQLESIDVGSVLADIVRAADDPASPLAGHVIRLMRPRRQAADSAIGPLADAIRTGRARDVVELLAGRLPERPAATNVSEAIGDAPSTTPRQDVVFVDAGPLALGMSGSATIEAAVREGVFEPLRLATAAAESGNAAEALTEFGRVRVLCAHRRGLFGVQRWNRTIESWLQPDGTTQRDYPGRPLLTTRNDQRQRIANGDTGVVVHTAVGRRAAFASGGGIRLLAPAQLDMVETAYAMTIHKSQGSEYETVVVVLPPADSPLVGRELLYTAVTRATTRLIVVGTTEAVIASVDSPARRVTGLAAALR